MKSALFTIALVLSIATHAAAIVLPEPSCPVNYCYVIDDSTRLSAVDFESQREFALVTAAIIPDINTQIGAYKYGSGASLLSPLTNDLNAFLLAIDDLQQSAVGSNGTGMPMAIKGCMDLFDSRKAKLNILVTSGVGATASEEASATSNAVTLRTSGATIIAAPAATANQSFFESLTGSPSLVIANDDIFTYIEAIDTATKAACK